MSFCSYILFLALSSAWAANLGPTPDQKASWPKIRDGVWSVSRVLKRKGRKPEADKPKLEDHCHPTDWMFRGYFGTAAVSSWGCQTDVHKSDDKETHLWQVTTTCQLTKGGKGVSRTYLNLFDESEFEATGDTVENGTQVAGHRLHAKWVKACR